MKKQLSITICMAIALLAIACTKPPTVDVDATVNARFAQQSTATAIVWAQSTIQAQQTSLAATGTAIAGAQATPVVQQASLTPAPTKPPVKPAQPASSPTPGVGAGVTCPFYVYADFGSSLNHYTSAGWMGDISSIKFDDNYKLDKTRPDVIQITYTPGEPNKWAGIYWWDPPNSNWAEIDGGFNLSCAKELTFLAKGQNGGEKGEFKVGGLKGKGTSYQDSLQPAFSTGPITLTKEWAEYSLDLSGKDLRHIIGGFVWVTNNDSNPNGATIYLDDIQFK